MAVTTTSLDAGIARRHEPRSRGRAGGAAALVAAATFVFGIALYATTLRDYTSGDPAPEESVDFVVAHQGTLVAWYVGVFLVFGAALIPTVLALHRRVRAGGADLAAVATALGVIWAGLMFASGMVANVGVGAVADLAATDRAAAASLWSSLDAVTNGLGGGNEIVGGLWVLLVSVAARRAGTLPRGLAGVGVASAVAGVATVVPALEPAGMVFGLGLVVWFAWVGVVLRRDQPAA